MRKLKKELSFGLLASRDVNIFHALFDATKAILRASTSP